MPVLKPLLLPLMLILLSGCAQKSTPYDVDHLAKRDIDMVADAHVDAIKVLLLELTEKLYKRNPSELKKARGATIASRQQQLFLLPLNQKNPILEGKRSIEAMLLSFDEAYEGDRVFALMTGLTGMLHDAYDNQYEFFLLDQLDQQKLYNSARNIEVLAWRLRSRKQKNGQPFFITTGTGDVINLSFERLFGKMIAHQDMMAVIVAQKTKRTINLVVHGISTFFLPI